MRKLLFLFTALLYLSCSTKPPEKLNKQQYEAIQCELTQLQSHIQKQDSMTIQIANEILPDYVRMKYMIFLTNTKRMTR